MQRRPTTAGAFLACTGTVGFRPCLCCCSCEEALSPGDSVLLRTPGTPAGPEYPQIMLILEGQICQNNPVVNLPMVSTLSS